VAGEGGKSEVELALASKKFAVQQAVTAAKTNSRSDVALASATQWCSTESGNSSCS